MIEIRRGEAGDLEALVALSQGVHGLHLAARGDEFRELSDAQARADLEGALADGEQILLVGLATRRVAGYVLAKVVDRQENPLQKARRFLYLDQIAVDPECRNQGVGCGLVEAVQEAARANRIDRILLDVWAFNSEAREFFRRRGFAPMLERLESGPC